MLSSGKVGEIINVCWNLKLCHVDVVQEVSDSAHEDQHQEAVWGALQDVPCHWQDQQLLAEDFIHSDPRHHDDVQV